MNEITDYQKYIHKSRYARWREDLGRRETWEETVDRYINYMYNQIKNKTTISDIDLDDLYALMGATCEK